jgi:hypothetical protein
VVIVRSAAPAARIPSDHNVNSASPPALSYDWLAPGATVVLDDAERPGEREVLRRWEHETGLDFDRRAEQAGMAVARFDRSG